MVPHCQVLAHVADGLFQRFRGEIPGLFIANVIFRHGGHFDLIGQAKDGVNFIEQTHHVLDFFLHLIPSHKDVGIVLGETADTEQAVERTGQLVTMHQTQLGHAQGQVTIGVRLGLVDQHTARTVHGLDGVIFAVDDGGIHIVLVMFPVAAAVP